MVRRSVRCAVYTACNQHTHGRDNQVYAQSVDLAPIRDWATSSKRPHACKSRARRCCCCVQYVKQ